MAEQHRLPRFKTIDHAIDRLTRQLAGASGERSDRLKQRLDALTVRKEALDGWQPNDLSLDIIALIARYRFLPVSLLMRLLPQDQARKQQPRTIAHHLQQLWLKGYVKRFQTARNVGEFNYYIDSDNSLRLLADRASAGIADLPWEEVKTNRRGNYAQAAQKGDSEKLLFLRHELMISRFHGILELACAHSKGFIDLITWQQGSALWDTVEVPKFVYDRDLKAYRPDSRQTETIPFRPDAFFGLRFTLVSGQEAERYFFYEADRQTMTLAAMRRKFRAYFHYVAIQGKHKERYGVERIRAVAIETLTGAWVERLIEDAAAHETVSAQPSPLFWLTTSERFESLKEAPDSFSGRTRKLPKYLRQPNIVFAPIWVSPAEYDWQHHRPTTWHRLVEDS